MMERKYAFVLPDKWTLNQINWFRVVTSYLRQDQIDRVFHLIQSWGAKQGMLAGPFVRLCHRAIKNTLNNLP